MFVNLTRRKIWSKKDKQTFEWIIAIHSNVLVVAAAVSCSKQCEGVGINEKCKTCGYEVPTLVVWGSAYWQASLILSIRIGDKLLTCEWEHAALPEATDTSVWRSLPRLSSKRHRQSCFRMIFFPFFTTCISGVLPHHHPSPPKSPPRLSSFHFQKRGVLYSFSESRLSSQTEEVCHCFSSWRSNATGKKGVFPKLENGKISQGTRASRHSSLF